MTEDLGLNVLQFKFRIHDPAIGRFWQIDPLAEEYVYNSTYAFSENRVIDAWELEGLEKVLVNDREERPKDDGTKGTTYTAEVYVLNEQTGDVSGPYKGSSYPNSKSNSDNSTNANTISEGEHKFDNKSGHKGSTEKGLNIVNENNGKRETTGKSPNGDDVTMTNVNVHSGKSDKGNFNSRGSQGCVTISPADSKAFFSNFDFSGTNSNTGKAQGTINIVRGTSEQRKEAVKTLKAEGKKIKEQNHNNKPN